MAESYDFKKIETDVLAFWQQQQVYSRIKQRNAGKKPFFYLDGPPYTTGKIHIGHALGKALRDALMRYKRMRGFDVWDQPGFDMHGLPIEVSVEKQLGINNKKEITEKFGIQKFIEACQQYALDNMYPMIEDFKRLGVWMDWDKPYTTIANEYIEGAWWALAQAHAKKLLYRGKKAMCWCPRCATALAKHELDYKNRVDPSLFVKLPVVGKKHEYLIVWTTTPWTLPFNTGVMAHPEHTYVRAKTASGETWILAKALAGVVIQGVAEQSFTIVEEFTGDKLADLNYVPLFSELDAVKALQKSYGNKAYRVVLSEDYVDLSAGSGLVHCAPGCGGEDFEVGQKNGLPAFNEVDEHGVFPAVMGTLVHLRAKEDDSKFIDAIRAKGLLVAANTLEHEYAHCWRCKTPVIYRATDQWFIAVEGLKQKMREGNAKVHWVPDWAGQRQFDSWLAGLQDWCISRQRFWGIPLPIWVCDECQATKLVTTREEIEHETGREIKNLHRPWVDAVHFACTCGGKMSRTPDVLDVWLDSGVAPWATLGFPRKKEPHATLGTPDFILEGKDQIRGWFNSLMCMSMVSFGTVPYKAIYMHGMINDSQGRKMSKSLKNIISPYEVIEQYGADAMRLYFIGASDPGLDLPYNSDDGAQRYRTVSILWNIQSFLLDLLDQAELTKDEIASLQVKPGVEEQYLLALLRESAHEITKAFDEYRIHDAPKHLETLVHVISRTYIQMIREKVQEEEGRLAVIGTLAHVLTSTLVLAAPIIPFVTESLWQRLREHLPLETASVHEMRWTDVKHDGTVHQMLVDVDEANAVIGAALAGREKMGRSLRWPVARMTVVRSDSAARESLKRMHHLLVQQANVKEVLVTDRAPELSYKASIVHATCGKVFGKRTPQIAAALEKADGTVLRHQLTTRREILLNIDGEDVKLTPEQVKFTEVVPEHLVAMELKGGFVYLEKETTDALEAEGFVREVMRRIQSARKKANLTKKNKIHLSIKTTAATERMVVPWKEQISQKTGCASILISGTCDLASKLFSSEETIKQWTIGIGFDVECE